MFYVKMNDAGNKYLHPPGWNSDYAHARRPIQARINPTARNLTGPRAEWLIAVVLLAESGCDQMARYHCTKHQQTTERKKKLCARRTFYGDPRSLVAAIISYSSAHSWSFCLEAAICDPSTVLCLVNGPRSFDRRLDTLETGNTD